MLCKICVTQKAKNPQAQKIFFFFAFCVHKKTQKFLRQLLDKYRFGISIWLPYLKKNFLCSFLKFDYLKSHSVQSSLISLLFSVINTKCRMAAYCLDVILYFSTPNRMSVHTCMQPSTLANPQFSNLLTRAGSAHFACPPVPVPLLS